ncbi:MAG TPA: histidinol-phosphate transaminase [Paludibacteraceae bacterium]|nr:histidinol-phosphate transaminase [Paludibacteraceae bacterium]
MNINELLRENIKKLEPYSCARNDFKGEASIYLDANENPFNDPYNRYPDPLQAELKEQFSKIKNISTSNIFLGNGSDEAIDLLYRAFCEPRIDNVVAIEPTYGMYRVCAEINDVEFRKVLLNKKFDIEAYKLMDATNERTKIIWLCSPNNPTGNSLDGEEIRKILKWFRGIVVIDEAYIDFSNKESFLKEISQYPQLVILQTMSKAWGNAAIRLGMAFASEEIIQVLNKIKYPYNVNFLTQQHALKVLQDPFQMKKWVSILLEEREKLRNELSKLAIVEEIFPSDANFLLVKVKDANMIYQYLIKKGIVVRNRHNMPLCTNCLRITVGTPDENNVLINTLKKLYI